MAIKKSSGDSELSQIYKKMGNEIRAAEALANFRKKKPDYKDKQAAMKIVQDLDLTSKNAPGGFKKGGSVNKKKKFPDLSGDGKITKKDILMAKGVIKKTKKRKK
jgi:hypothetical protein